MANNATGEEQVGQALGSVVSALERAGIDPQKKQTVESALGSSRSTLNLVLKDLREESEIRRLRALEPKAEKAIRERDKALEQLKAAEDARNAAERVAERETSERRNAEALLEELRARIMELTEQPSRLARLRDELGL
jgi:hypothetical protein